MVLLFAEERRQYNAEQTFMELRNTFDESINNVNYLSSAGMILYIVLGHLTSLPLNITRTGSNSYVIPHSHQQLRCLKSGVSYSSTVSLPINQELSTLLLTLSRPGFQKLAKAGGRSVPPLKHGPGV